MKPREIISGVLLVATGAFFFFGAFQYPIGTPDRMQAGYFPMILGAITMGVGALIIFTSPRQDSVSSRPVLRPLIAIGASIVLFGLTVRPFGLIPASFLAAGVSAMGDRTFRILSTVIVAASAAICAWLIFIVGLNLPLQAIRMPL